MTKRAKVLISGFGGGVAQFAFQFALAAGADVYVTSGSEEKVNKAMELGAIDGFNYHDKEWSKNAFRKYGGFDIVIDSSGGDQLNTLVRLMKPGGRIVFYGATNGLPESIDLYRMFWNQLTLQGSTMGNDGEFSDMLDFVGRHKIVPIMDSVRPFREIVSAFDTLATSNRIGKLVINYE